MVLLLQAIEEHDLFCPGFDLTVEFIEVIGHDPAEHGQKCAVVYCIINSLFPNPFYLFNYFLFLFHFIYLFSLEMLNVQYGLLIVWPRQTLNYTAQSGVLELPKAMKLLMISCGEAL